ncbi:hypothetical protein OS493_014677 [Desmophyllum pertusum]|uniref:RRM domain-containing protein n=1 Tax=Desmophyllum pertusum TaxID=174260 RepID=A0A9W9YGE0_9CNID|nr:hypothetical protein OS493_014677 [Desmophyllum pertusum]
MSYQSDSAAGCEDERLLKLFVGGLKRDTADDTLKEYFEKYGELSDCVIIRDNQQGNKVSRGFGYVTFKATDSILQVLQEKKDGPHSIDGKEVEVKRAIPKDDQSPTAHLKVKKIFIGGLPDEATKEDIQQALTVRDINPANVDLIMKKNEDGTISTKHRGFCFVELVDEDIVDEFCCIKKVDICGKMVEIKKAEPKDKGGQGQGGRGGRGGARGGYSRGGGGGGGYYSGGDFGGGGYPQGGYQGGYNPYQGYADPSAYAYYDPYGGGMGTYPQAASTYGAQSYGGQGGRGRGGGRYQPY